jgi:hypothetical protein
LRPQQTTTETPQEHQLHPKSKASDRENQTNISFLENFFQKNNKKSTFSVIPMKVLIHFLV